MNRWLRDKYTSIKDDCKQAWKSFTILFNGVVATVAITLPQVISEFPQLQEYMSEPSYKTWMLIMMVGNFILRFKTTKALKHK